MKPTMMATHPPWTSANATTVAGGGATSTGQVSAKVGGAAANSENGEQKARA